MGTKIPTHWDHHGNIDSVKKKGFPARRGTTTAGTLPDSSLNSHHQHKPDHPVPLIPPVPSHSAHPHNLSLILTHQHLCSLQERRPGMVPCFALPPAQHWQPYNSGLIASTSRSPAPYLDTPVSHLTFQTLPCLLQTLSCTTPSPSIITGLLDDEETSYVVFIVSEFPPGCPSRWRGGQRNGKW